MKRIGRLLSVITWLLVAGSVVIIAGGLFGRPLLLAAVPTGSMVPVLRPGDLIVVLPTWTMNPPGLNDVVVFRTAASPRWIVHRIIDGNSAEGFVTKGDANPTADTQRVLPGDIAGIVPHWGGAALRLPRLGLLSSGGPLSSPVVAGVALAVGVFLLLMDFKPEAPGRVQQKIRPQGMLALYAGLAATVVVTTMIPAWTLSSRQTVRYEVVAQKSSGNHAMTLNVQGRPVTDRVTIPNSSPFPLVVTVRSSDPDVVVSPAHALLMPRQQKGFELTLLNRSLGTHEARLETGVFLPLLPPAVLSGLSGLHLAVAVIANAMVPGLLVLVLAMIDRHSRTAISRWWHRVRIRILL